MRVSTWKQVVWNGDLGTAVSELRNMVLNNEISRDMYLHLRWHLLDSSALTGTSGDEYNDALDAIDMLDNHLQVHQSEFNVGGK